MKRAFTLIEVTMTVALFIILAFGIEQLYVTYTRVIDLQKSSIGVALGANAIMDAVRTAGLQADHVVASHTFGSLTLASGTSTVVFELPSVDASGAIIASAFDYVGIYASSTNAYRVVDGAVGSARADASKLLTPALSALSFSYDSANFSAVTSVTADATTSAVSRGQATQLHEREHAYLRNL